MTYKQYQRKQIAELADWHEGFDMAGVSVSDADKAAGSPKQGDKIARNPKNHADRWLVAADYFAENFSPCSAPEGEYVPLTAEQKQALNRAHLASVKVVTPAPDEALIEEIAKEVINRWRQVPKDSLLKPILLLASKWAIRKYIRLSAGKEKT